MPDLAELKLASPQPIPQIGTRLFAQRGVVGNHDSRQSCHAFSQAGLEVTPLDGETLQVHGITRTLERSHRAGCTQRRCSQTP